MPSDDTGNMNGSMSTRRSQTITDLARRHGAPLLTPPAARVPFGLDLLLLLPVLLALPGPTLDSCSSPVHDKQSRRLKAAGK